MRAPLCRTVAARIAAYFALGAAISSLDAESVHATSWTARYEGVGRDEPVALAVDDSANVYVTGSSEWGSGGTDILTFKYSASGTLAWMRRYDGPAHSDDYAQALAVASDGSVYVAGSSEGAGTERDCVTLKYDRNGALQWTRRFDGGDRDFAQAVIATADGGVAAAGGTYIAGHGLDLMVLKYSSAGDPDWQAIADGPGHWDDVVTALALAPSNGLFVVGIETDTTGLGDYVIRRLDATGSETWTRRYNGPGNQDDWAFALAADSLGNAFVTGFSVGDGGSADIATQRYAGDGTPAWTARYDGPGADFDGGEAVRLGSDGSVYVAGVSDNTGANRDFVTLKYSADGSQEWVRLFNGRAAGFDEAVAMTVDSLGRLVVAGISTVLLNNEDYAVVAYSSAGDTIWRWSYDGPASGHDRLAAIVAVPGGYVVTGASTGDSTGWDFATVRFDSASSVVSVPRADRPPGVFALRWCSPNPTRDIAAFDVDFPWPGALRVVLYDLQGRMVRVGIPMVPLATGTHRMHVNGSGLPAGMYIARITGRTGARLIDERHKFVLVR